MQVPAGTTSYRQYAVQWLDDAGAVVTGKVAADFPAAYVAAGVTTPAALTLSDLASIGAAYAAGGVKEYPNMPGLYRVDLPDSCFAVNGAKVRVAFAEEANKRFICPLLEVQSAGTITPVSATVGAGEVTGDSFTAYQNSTRTYSFGIADANGDAVDLSGKTVRFTASPRTDPNNPVIIHDNDQEGGLEVGGTGNATVSVEIDDTDTATQRVLVYSIWNVTDDQPLAEGIMTIKAISQVVS